MSVTEAIELLGEHICDGYLNVLAYWSNIPPWVWEYTIGGYQLIKKWLLYRKEKPLSHLPVEEMAEPRLHHNL